MPGAHDFQIADVDEYLRGEVIITRRNINDRAGLAAAVTVSLRLSAFYIGDDAVDHLANITVRVAGMPAGDIIMVIARHQ